MKATTPFGQRSALELEAMRARTLTVRVAPTTVASTMVATARGVVREVGEVEGEQSEVLQPQAARGDQDLGGIVAIVAGVVDVF